MNDISKIHLQKADLSDSEFLFVCRNDALTRQNSVTQSELDPVKHGEWLAKALANPDIALYIALSGGEKVGTVRIERAVGNADYDNELSWTVHPAFRGRGLGKLIVKKATLESGSRILARIRKANESSLRIAEFAGFKHYRDEGDFVLMIFN